MQQYAPDGTKQERSGFRDEWLSQRHRLWGVNLPIVDIDAMVCGVPIEDIGFAVCQYDEFKAVALIEYKHFKRAWRRDEAGIRALTDLADNYSPGALPFTVVRYWPEDCRFHCTPMNAPARLHFDETPTLTEMEYVPILYRMRRMARLARGERNWRGDPREESRILAKIAALQPRTAARRLRPDCMAVAGEIATVSH